jgi:hypothetical protein
MIRTIILDDISRYQKLSEDFMERYKHRLCETETETETNAWKFSGIPWDYRGLSQNPSITFDRSKIPYITY